MLAAVNVNPTGWYTSPAVLTALRKVLKSATAGSDYIATAGRIGDLPASASNAAPVDTAILGDFSQVLLGQWGAVEILVNPFAEAPYRRGGVLVRAFSTVDVQFATSRRLSSRRIRNGRAGAEIRSGQSGGSPAYRAGGSLRFGNEDWRVPGAHCSRGFPQNPRGESRHPGLERSRPGQGIGPDQIGHVAIGGDRARPPVPVAAARYNYRERPAGACTTRRPWRRELRLSCGQGFVGRRAAYVARSRAARGFDCAELACVSRYNRRAA